MESLSEANQASDRKPKIFYPHGTFRGKVLLAVSRDLWFVNVRWIIIFAVMALLTLEHFYTPAYRRPNALWWCIIILAASNVIWFLISRSVARQIEADAKRKRKNEESEHTSADSSNSLLTQVLIIINAQMVVDLLVLTLILRYSGGIENPMAVFYVFHMVLAALLLRPTNAMLQGLCALVLYSLLICSESFGWTFPHFPFLPSMQGLELHLDPGNVFVSICVLAAGIFGTLFFTMRISSRLDLQEQDLASAHDNLKRSQLAIKDLQSRRSRFMLTAAHQLKSPVAGIEMLANLIRDDVVPPDGIPGVIERIIERCRGAIAQVGELLTLARIEDASPKRHHQAMTDVVETVKRVIHKHADYAKGKKITLTHDDTGCSQRVACVDERDLEDCVTNLVENAIKYTPNGGRVDVTLLCHPTATVLSVRDTGIGIAEDAEDALFDPFRRGKLALQANIPGTGLGLAIVREVVEQANGSIEVQSKIGEGSEFILTLPRPDTPGYDSQVRGTRQTTMTRSH